MTDVKHNLQALEMLNQLLGANKDIPVALRSYANSQETPYVFEGNLITRNRKHNPMLQAFAKTPVHVQSTVERRDTPESVDVQEFYQSAEGYTTALVKIFKDYLAKKFAIEMSIPDIHDFMLESLPDDVSYLEDITAIQAQIATSLAQQLYLDLMSIGFSCDPRILEARLFNSSTDATSLKERLLKAWEDRDKNVKH